MRLLVIVALVSFLFAPIRGNASPSTTCIELGNSNFCVTQNRLCDSNTCGPTGACDKTGVCVSPDCKGFSALDSINCVSLDSQRGKCQNGVCVSMCDGRPNLPCFIPNTTDVGLCTFGPSSTSLNCTSAACVNELAICQEVNMTTGVVRAQLGQCYNFDSVGMKCRVESCLGMLDDTYCVRTTADGLESNGTCKSNACVDPLCSTQSDGGSCSNGFCFDKECLGLICTAAGQSCATPNGRLGKCTADGVCKGTNCSALGDECYIEEDSSAGLCLTADPSGLTCAPESCEGRGNLAICASAGKPGLCCQNSAICLASSGACLATGCEKSGDTCIIKYPDTSFQLGACSGLNSFVCTPSGQRSNPTSNLDSRFQFFSNEVYGKEVEEVTQNTLYLPLEHYEGTVSGTLFWDDSTSTASVTVTTPGYQSTFDETTGDLEVQAPKAAGRYTIPLDVSEDGVPQGRLTIVVIVVPKPPAPRVIKTVPELNAAKNNAGGLGLREKLIIDVEVTLPEYPQLTAEFGLLLYPKVSDPSIIFDADSTNPVPYTKTIKGQLSFTHQYYSGSDSSKFQIFVEDELEQRSDYVDVGIPVKLQASANPEKDTSNALEDIVRSGSGGLSAVSQLLASADNNDLDIGTDLAIDATGTVLGAGTGTIQAGNTIVPKGTDPEISSVLSGLRGVVSDSLEKLGFGQTNARKFTEAEVAATLALGQKIIDTLGKVESTPGTFHEKFDTTTFVINSVIRSTTSVSGSHFGVSQQCSTTAFTDIMKQLDLSIVASIKTNSKSWPSGEKPFVELKNVLVTNQASTTKKNNQCITLCYRYSARKTTNNKENPMNTYYATTGACGLRTVTNHIHDNIVTATVKGNDSVCLNFFNTQAKACTLSKTQSTQWAGLGAYQFNTVQSVVKYAISSEKLDTQAQTGLQVLQPLVKQPNYQCAVIKTSGGLSTSPSDVVTSKADGICYVIAEGWNTVVFIPPTQTTAATPDNIVVPGTPVSQVPINAPEGGNGLAVGLGVGIGLGGAVVLLGIGVAIYFYTRTESIEEAPAPKHYPRENVYYGHQAPANTPYGI